MVSHTHSCTAGCLPSQEFDGFSKQQRHGDVGRGSSSSDGLTRNRFRCNTPMSTQYYFFVWFLLLAMRYRKRFVAADMHFNCKKCNFSGFLEDISHTAVPLNPLIPSWFHASLLLVKTPQKKWVEIGVLPLKRFPC